MSVKSKYPCKQVELYSVAMATMHSFSENQLAFEAFKPKYADPYKAELNQKLEDALDLPGFQMRDMRTEVAGIQLKEAAKRCLDNWQALKRYIRDVQGWENLQKPKLEAAGSKEYAKAASYNWEYVAILGHEATLFMEQYSAELQADGNMTPPFMGSFGADLNAYLSQYNDLLDATQDNAQETKAKVEANNALYDALMAMMDDGQFIFRSDSTLRNRFTFLRVLNRIRRPSGGGTPAPAPEPGIGEGSMSGTVTRSDNGMPLAMAEVTIASLGVVAQTDINGSYSLSGVAAGTHTVMGWHTDMESLEKEVTVMANAGVTVDFNLQPLEE